MYWHWKYLQRTADTEDLLMAGQQLTQLYGNLPVPSVPKFALPKCPPLRTSRYEEATGEAADDHPGKGRHLD